MTLCCHNRTKYQNTTRAGISVLTSGSLPRFLPTAARQCPQAQVLKNQGLLEPNQQVRTQTEGIAKVEDESMVTV